MATVLCARVAARTTCKFACICENKKAHGTSVNTRGTRGSKPGRQGSEARVSKQRAHSVGSAAAAVTRVLSSTFPSSIDDVRRVREDSRGDDASLLSTLVYETRAYPKEGTTVLVL